MFKISVILFLLLLGCTPRSIQTIPLNTKIEKTSIILVDDDSNFEVGQVVINELLKHGFNVITDKTKKHNYCVFINTHWYGDTTEITITDSSSSIIIGKATIDFSSSPNEKLTQRMILSILNE